MSVIINDFEIEVAQPNGAERPGAKASSDVKAPMRPLAPMEVHDIMRQQAARQARLRAH